MADNTTLNAGTGGDVIATDDIAGVKHQLVKVEFGAADSATQVSAAAPLPVQISDGTDVALVTAAGAQVVDGSGVTQPVSGTVSANLNAGTNNIGDVDVLSVPAPLSTTGGGTEATAHRVTIANDSTGVLSVDDNGASLTVDAPVATPVHVRLSDGTDVTNVTAAGELNVLATAQPGVDVGDVTVNNASGASAVNIQDGGNSITVDGTVSVNLNAGTNTNEVVGDAAHDAAIAGNPLTIGGVASAAAPTDVNADQDAVRTWHLRNGAMATVITAAGALIPGDATNGLDVDVIRLPASTNTIEVVGDAAHDAAVAGNPVLVCGAAQDTDDTAPPNRVSAESDATRLATDRDGSLHVLPFGPQIWSYHENSSSALTDTSVHAAPGAGLSLYVGSIVVSTGAATALNIFFEEGASTVLGPYYLEATNGRGMSIQFNPPKKITANTALTVTTSAAIAHGIDVTGYVAQG